MTALTTSQGICGMADAPLKTCYICKQHLPHDSFVRARSRPDGRYPYCRKCDAEKRAARKASDPEWAAMAAAKKREYDAQYVAKNKEAKRAYAHAYYWKNRESVKAAVRQWQDSNPEAVRAYKLTTKIKRRAASDGGMTGRQLVEWKRQQPKVCYWCGVKCARHYHVDHYVPLVKGGKHEASNLVIACPTCNLNKHAKDPMDFARERGRLL